jgi:hypothetical protein
MLPATGAASTRNGFNPLFDRTRKQMPATPAFCFAHARRKFFELADVARNAWRGRGAKPISPLALEAVKRMDALFAIERYINGFSAAERAGLSRSSPVAGPIDYMLSRWADFARYADDGRICMTNNAAERALRGVAITRKNSLFVGSEGGGRTWATLATFLQTCWGGRPPNRHRCARMRSLQISSEGDRPWKRLPASEWTRQSTSFSCMA